MVLSITRWDWDFGNEASSDEMEPRFDYVARTSFFGYDLPGMYTVNLTVANVDSVSQASKQVEVLVTPSPEFKVTRSGNTITVEASDADAVDWQWDFGDGATASGLTATHTYTSTETLQQAVVELSVEASNGCVSSSYQFIESAASNVYLPIIIK